MRQTFSGRRCSGAYSSPISACRGLANLIRHTGEDTRPAGGERGIVPSLRFRGNILRRKPC